MRTKIPEFTSYIIIQKGYSPRTAEAYTFDLEQFAQFLEKTDRQSEIDVICQRDILAFLMAISNNEFTGHANGVISRARKLASIRSFFKYLVRVGSITADPTLLVELPSIPVREPDYLTIPEYQKLLAAVELYASPFFHSRDVAIMCLFITTGLRVSELVNLKVDDLLQDPISIRLHRKGNKVQTVPIPEAVGEHIQKYLKNRAIDSSFVFLGKRQNQMTPSGIYTLVKKYLYLAGLHKAKNGPHLLRHTCFTTLVQNEVNPAVIQALAGHASFDTTKRYLHINDKQIQKAVETINI